MNLPSLEIFKFYSKAKRSALLAQDNKTGSWYHIFSVIELLPSDIPEYSIPTKEWHQQKIIRSQFSAKKELYTFSLIVNDLTVNEALNIFYAPIQNNLIDDQLNYFFNAHFIQEPAGIIPLVLPSNIYEESGLGAILPRRNSGMLVWSQIDFARTVENRFVGESINHAMKSMSQLTNDWLGFDIWSKPEHIGNIYLTAPNPYFRDLDLTLSHQPPGVFYHLKLRKGINEKFSIRIVDKHGDHTTIDQVFKIENPIDLIQLPHEPNLIECSIYNSNNDLIYKFGPVTFIKSIQFDMNIKHADFNVTVQDTGDEFTVEKYSAGKPVKIGKTPNFNPSYYFKDAENKRKHINNRKNTDFIFFRGVTDNETERKNQKEEAKRLVRDLINRAKFRCYICDPYFGVSDLLDFAFYIKNTNVELKLINSNEGMKKEIALSLIEAIKLYNEKPFQKIELRTLKKNVLHDRFIVSDNHVWFIGTSLNKIGVKASCIAKVPESDNFEIIREIENWFYNKKGNYSQSLEEYANNFTK